MASARACERRSARSVSTSRTASSRDRCGCTSPSASRFIAIANRRNRATCRGGCVAAARREASATACAYDHARRRRAAGGRDRGARRLCAERARPAVHRRAHRRANRRAASPSTIRPGRSPARCAFAASRGAAPMQPSRRTMSSSTGIPARCGRERLSIRGLGARHVDIALKPSTGPTAPPTDLRLPLAVDIERLAIAELDVARRPARRTDIRPRVRLCRRRAIAPDPAAAPRVRFRQARRRSVGRCAGAAARSPGPRRSPATVCWPARRRRRRYRHRCADRHRRRRDAARRRAVAAGDRDAVRRSAVRVGDRRLDRCRRGEVRSGVAAYACPRPSRRAAARRRHRRIARTRQRRRRDRSTTSGCPSRGCRRASSTTDDALALDDARRDACRRRWRAGQRPHRRSVARTRCALSLDVRDLDLVRVHSKLVATRLSGHLSGDATAARQTLEGDVRDRDIGLAFAAVDRRRARRSVAVSRDDAGRIAPRHRPDGLERHECVHRRRHDAATRSVAFRRRAGRVARRQRRRTRRAASPLARRCGRRRRQGSRIDGVPASGDVQGHGCSGHAARRDDRLALASARSVHASGRGRRRGRSPDVYDRRAADCRHRSTRAAGGMPRPLAGERTRAACSRSSPADARRQRRFPRAGAARRSTYGAQTLQGQARSHRPPAGSRNALGDRARWRSTSRQRNWRCPARTIDTAHATVAGPLSRHHATLALQAPRTSTSRSRSTASLANADLPARRRVERHADGIRRIAEPFRSSCARPRRSRCATAISGSPTPISTPAAALPTSPNSRGTTAASRRAARFPASPWPTPRSSRASRCRSNRRWSPAASGRSPRHRG